MTILAITLSAWARLATPAASASQTSALLQTGAISAFSVTTRAYLMMQVSTIGVLGRIAHRMTTVQVMSVIEASVLASRLGHRLPTATKR